MRGKGKVIPARNTRRKLRGSRASRTNGKDKGENCQTDPQKKFFASSPKAHKHPQYNEWNAKFRKINMGSKVA